MNLEQISEKIRCLSLLDLQHKSISDMCLSAAEEFGEFCREIKIEESVYGNSHKNPGNDGSVGEAIDMIIMALALYHARLKDHEQATDELAERLEKKLEKWGKNQK